MIQTRFDSCSILGVDGHAALPVLPRYFSIDYSSAARHPTAAASSPHTASPVTGMADPVTAATVTAAAASSSVKVAAATGEADPVTAASVTAAAASSPVKVAAATGEADAVTAASVTAAGSSDDAAPSMGFPDSWRFLGGGGGGGGGGEGGKEGGGGRVLIGRRMHPCIDEILRNYSKFRWRHRRKLN